MTIKEVVNHFGTLYKLSRVIGVAHVTVYRWRDKGYIPVKWQRKIESLTQGELKSKLILE